MSSSKFVKSVLSDKKVAPVSNGYISKNEEWKFSVARVMLTGILKNQYYRSAEDQAKEALPLLISAAQKDPEFVLRAACFARDANMKGMLKLGLACVAGQASDDFLARQEVKECASSLLSTFHPGQLIQFVELMKSKQCGRGFGARPQKWVASVMESWSEDKTEQYTLKYPTAFNSLLRLVHPKLDKKNGDLSRYVLTPVKGNKKNGTASGKVQKAVEKLKAGASSKEIAVGMLDNNIPWDNVKGWAKMDRDVWIACMVQMGLSGLLLNMNALDKHGVFDKDGIQALKLKMNEVKKGRSIPIDFAKPYIHCSNQDVRNILLDAMADVLTVPMPALEGRSVGVSIDISGSMEGETLQTAGLLAVPFIKSQDLWFTTFDTELWEEGTRARNGGYWGGEISVCPKIKGLTPRKQIENLLSLRVNGGTNVSVSLQAAIKNRRKLDLMVIVTDEQQNDGTPLITVWNQYKQLVNPRAELWIINATNTQWHSADFNDPSVTVYQSMTSAIFNNLKFLGQDLVSAVEKYSLTVKNKSV